MNCGYGHGFIVKEVLNKVRQILKRKRVHVVRDPAIVMSKAEKIGKVLGWKPQYDDLDLIIRSAYEWEKKGLY